jgi:drug/metabolite transporter (DMT)-like permease
VLFGWYFLGDTIGPLQILGVIVVLTSMAMLLTATPAPMKAG